MARRLAVVIATLGLLFAIAPAASIAVGEPTPAECDAQVNDTPAKLLPCIQTDALWQHMVNFQAIADANPGPDGHASRNSGEPGYWASVQYVANAMEAAGYDVTIQPYTFFYSAYVGTPTWSEDTPAQHDFALVTEWNPGKERRHRPG